MVTHLLHFSSSPHLHFTAVPHQHFSPCWGFWFFFRMFLRCLKKHGMTTKTLINFHNRKHLNWMHSGLVWQHYIIWLWTPDEDSENCIKNYRITITTVSGHLHHLLLEESSLFHEGHNSSSAHSSFLSPFLSSLQSSDFPFQRQSDYWTVVQNDYLLSYLNRFLEVRESQGTTYFIALYCSLYLHLTNLEKRNEDWGLHKPNCHIAGTVNIAPPTYSESWVCVGLCVCVCAWRKDVCLTQMVIFGIWLSGARQTVLNSALTTDFK